MYKYFFVLLITIIVFSGCKLQEEVDTNVNSDVDILEIGKPLVMNIDASIVDEITIRTTMTDEHPSVKILVQRDEIDSFISELNYLKGERIADDDSKGWQYWIIIDGYNISIIGNRFELNDKVYRIDSLFYIKVKELYNNSVEEGKKYP